jgi:hypothetical protein
MDMIAERLAEWLHAHLIPQSRSEEEPEERKRELENPSPYRRLAELPLHPPEPVHPLPPATDDSAGPKPMLAKGRPRRPPPLPPIIAPPPTPIDE